MITAGCILSTYSPNGSGHCQVRVAGKLVSQHRLVYCEANGLSLAAIAGQCVLHKCDVPNCINPEHLILGTHQDNMQDMRIKGRRKAVTLALTAKQITEIRNSKEGTKLLAFKYAVSLCTIYRVKQYTRGYET